MNNNRTEKTLAGYFTRTLAPLFILMTGAMLLTIALTL